MKYICTAEGYLINADAWTPAFAEQIAAELEFALEDFDWQVLDYLRNFYKAHAMMPLTRLIIKYIKSELDSEFSSVKLQVRYSDKPLRVLAKMAGLSKPIQCI